jgi:hypothetical protein
MAWRRAVRFVRGSDDSLLIRHATFSKTAAVEPRSPASTSTPQPRDTRTV